MNAKYPRLSRALEPFVNAIPLLALLELATEIVTSNTAVSRYHGLLWVLEGSSELWSMHGTSICDLSTSPASPFVPQDAIDDLLRASACDPANADVRRELVRARARQRELDRATCGIARKMFGRG